MKPVLRHAPGILPILTLFSALLLCAPFPAPAAEGGEEPRQPEAPFVLEPRHYSSLPALAALVGRDALASFQDFFDATPLLVEPFVVFGEFPARRRVSLLGAVLAEQMAAVLGNEALARWRPETLGEEGQHLSGTLLEMDGYLRIQITGLNTRGERRSHVVNVEMSESVYRALHTHIVVP